MGVLYEKRGLIEGAIEKAGNMPEIHCRVKSEYAGSDRSCL
jgi:hypothetical protein